MAETQQNPNPTFRNVPENNLDLNMRVIDPDWLNATPDFIKKEKITGKYRFLEKDGQIFINVNDIVTNLDFFTRDIRLSNYDDKDIKMVRWYLEYAAMLAANKYFDAFNLCLNAVANISETSQGRKGFVRKIINTFRMENKNTTAEERKSSLWNGKPKPEN
jgi:hypothetical protein